MQEKTEEKYKEVMVYLQIKEILKLDVVVTDFEKSLMKWVYILGENIVLYGWLFHYGQCIWRKI